MVQKAVYFWVFVSAVWLVEAQAPYNLLTDAEVAKDSFGDYVVAGGNALKYSMSDKRPKQFVLYNEASKTGLVIDGPSERVVFEKLHGEKLVIDLRNEKVFEGNSIPHLTEDEFQKLLADYNTSTVLIETSVKMETEPPQVVLGFCESFKNLLRAILQLRETICKAIRTILSPIFEVLKVFGAFLILGAEIVFKVIKGGILALLNIFKWLARLLGDIIGGIIKFVDAGIKLVLSAIIGAANGAMALWEILKCFIEKFDLMKILEFILKIPKMICHFITGLGGKIIQGVTGVFEIIGKIFTYKIPDLFKLVKSYVKMILDFFKGERPSRENMGEAADKLLDIAKKQKDKFNHPSDYKNYEEFILATKGQGKFTVQGVILGKVVNIVVETGASAKGAVLEIFKVLNPMAPMKDTLPLLMVTMIDCLNTTDGIGYVKQLFPDLNITDGALASATRNLAAEIINPGKSADASILDLPPPAMLRSMPIVKDIYKEFDDAAIRYTNSSLESLLEKQHLVQFYDFTYKVVC